MDVRLTAETLGIKAKVNPEHERVSLKGDSKHELMRSARCSRGPMGHITWARAEGQAEGEENLALKQLVGICLREA